MVKRHKIASGGPPVPPAGGKDLKGMKNPLILVCKKNETVLVSPFQALNTEILGCKVLPIDYFFNILCHKDPV